MIFVKRLSLFAIMMVFLGGAGVMPFALAMDDAMMKNDDAMMKKHDSGMKQDDTMMKKDDGMKKDSMMKENMDKKDHMMKKKDDGMPKDKMAPTSDKMGK